MTIDLHCHTHYSDGKFSPAQVIEHAARTGIRVLAITDHDNLNGSREAAPLAQAAGIELITAMEITTRWDFAYLPPDDANVDLLAYFIDPDDPGLRAFEQAALDDVHERIRISCAYLTEHGTPVSIDEVLVENPRYAGALHTIEVMVKKGYGRSFNECARVFEPAWFSAPLPRFSIEDAIQQVHRAGGVAVLAHPAIVRPEGKQMTALHLRNLVDAGLDGIEVYHRRLDEAARAHFLGLAQQFDLLVTGGSDMHGWYRGLDELCREPIHPQILADLRRKANR